MYSLYREFNKNENVGGRDFVIGDIHDELVVNIQKFCSDNKYPAVSFCESYRTNEPVRGGKFKGWTVKRIK